MGWKHFESCVAENQALKVEREPMWDGNQVQINSKAALRMVEREPMWDGNIKKQ